MKRFLCVFLFWTISSVCVATEWEYKVTRYKTNGVNEESSAYLQKKFNNVGNKGWELVSIVYNDRTGQMLATFKRAAKH